MQIKQKQIYDVPSKEDGIRILIDRLWPRGITKERAQVDEWNKELAPSTELRKWFHEDKNNKDFEGFSSRYVKELESKKTELAALKHLSDSKQVTLLTAVKDVEHSYLKVLLEEILKES